MSTSARAFRLVSPLGQRPPHVRCAISSQNASEILALNQAAIWSISFFVLAPGSTFERPKAECLLQGRGVLVRRRLAGGIVAEGGGCHAGPGPARATGRRSGTPAKTVAEREPPPNQGPVRGSELQRIEQELSDALTAAVEIRVKKRTKRGEQGEVAIAFGSLDELNGLLEKLGLAQR